MAVFLVLIEIAFASAYHGISRDAIFPRDETGEALRGFALIAYGAAYVWVFARFSLILPYAAIGEGWQARRSWRRTSAIWFRFALLLALVLFVDVLLSTVVWRWATPAVADMAPDLGWLWSVAGPAMIAAKNLVTLALFLAIVVAVFARLTGRWIEGVPGGPPSPDETARVFD